MTTQYSISRAISGQTETSLKLFAINGDTVLHTANTVVERTNAKGQYLATFGEVAVIPAGNYTQIHFSSGGIPLSIGDRTFQGADGETATERAAELDPASITAVQSGLATQVSVNAIDNLLDTEFPALILAVAAIQTDTNDIQSRLPAALESGRMPASMASGDITLVQAGLATAVEVAKIPKVGSTHRYTQVAADSGTKRTDVAITDTP